MSVSRKILLVIVVWVPLRDYIYVHLFVWNLVVDRYIFDLERASLNLGCY